MAGAERVACEYAGRLRAAPRLVGALGGAGDVRPGGGALAEERGVRLRRQPRARRRSEVHVHLVDRGLLDGDRAVLAAHLRDDLECLRAVAAVEAHVALAVRRRHHNEHQLRADRERLAPAEEARHALGARLIAYGDDAAIHCGWD